jgi:hypothetical protein
MQHEKIGGSAGHDRVGAPIVVAEFDKHCAAAKLFNDRADLPTPEARRGQVREQRHDVELGWPRRSFAHHQSTQQVTKRDFRSATAGMSQFSQLS